MGVSDAPENSGHWADRVYLQLLWCLTTECMQCLRKEKHPLILDQTHTDAAWRQYSAFFFLSFIVYCQCYHLVTWVQVLVETTEATVTFNHPAAYLSSSFMLLVFVSISASVYGCHLMCFLHLDSAEQDKISKSLILPRWEYLGYLVCSRSPAPVQHTAGASQHLHSLRIHWCASIARNRHSRFVHSSFIVSSPSCLHSHWHFHISTNALRVNYQHYHHCNPV